MFNSYNNIKGDDPSPLVLYPKINTLLEYRFLPWVIAIGVIWTGETHLFAVLREYKSVILFLSSVLGKQVKHCTS